MKIPFVLPASILAATAALALPLSQRPQDPTPARTTPPPITAEDTAAPTRPPAAPVAVPPRGSTVPPSEPEEPATAPPVRPGPGDPVPPLPGASSPLVIGATVTLPGNQIFTARAPVPSDRDGFTWRMFQSRTTPKKQILGLHVYAPRQDPDLVVGTIRWSNGAVHPNGHDFAGAVYYDSFTLTSPPGWDWVTLPTKGQTVAGNRWVVIAAPPSGDNFARPREMLEWSYALVPTSNAAAHQKAIAALKYQDVVIPNPVVDYGPTKTTLPTVDRAKYASVCSGWASSLLGAQASGAKVYIENIADVEAEQMGAHWMDGLNLGYAFGGYGIDPTTGFAEQVPDAVLVHAIMHRANVARQFLAAYNLDSGQPIGLYDWTSPPNPQLMSGEPGRESDIEILPFLTGDYYTYHYPRFNTGNCAYEHGHTATINGVAVWFPGLWDYDSHDTAHSVRFFRNAIVLVEFAKDPAARDDILMGAEVNRYGWFSDRADEHTPKRNPNDGYWPNTLTYAKEVLLDHPHQGGWFDRNWAWSAFGGACAITYDPNPARVANWKAWGTNMLTTSSLAVDKFGFTGRYESAGNLPDHVSGIQTFHEMLVMTHRITLAMQVYGTVPPDLSATNRKGLTSALAALPPRPYGGATGPAHWFGTADNGVELAVLSDTFAYGEGDPAHVYAACAMTYRADVTHPEVLNLALPMWHPTADLPTMYSFCKQLFPDKTWGCEMESVLQKKLAR